MGLLGLIASIGSGVLNKGNNEALNGADDVYKNIMQDTLLKGEKVNYGLAGLSILNALNSKQNSGALIDKSNQQFESDRGQMNADLASMGYTPSANSVYADANASLSGEKNLAATEIENNIKEQNFDNLEEALKLSGGFLNNQFSTVINTLSKLYG